MTSLNGRRAETAAAEALDGYWDALTQPRPGRSGGPELDATLSRAVRRVQFGDDAPHVEPAFAARLWGELMAGAPLAAPGLGPGGCATDAPLARWGLPRQRVLVELLVAAALLIAVVGGGSAFRLPGALDSAAATIAAEAGAFAGCASAPEPTVVAAVWSAPAATLPPTPAGVTTPAEC